MKRGDSFYYSPEWRAIRRQVLARDRYRCAVCGCVVSAPGAARVDHIIPRRERPDLAMVLGNLRTLCALHDNQGHSEKGKGGGRRIEQFSGCDADGWPLRRG